MQTVATFEKISFDQFVRDYSKLCEDERFDIDAHLADIYRDIKLPVRQTNGSAGYDFFSPIKVRVSGTPITIPTGIRAKIEHGWFLGLFPRSGLGFKYGMRLENSTGIVDADYFYADNEGHIMARISSSRPFELEDGDRFIQGVLMPYGISTNGNGTDERTGGMGSTGR